MEPETGWLEDYNSVLLGWPRFSGKGTALQGAFFLLVFVAAVFPCGARNSRSPPLLPFDSDPATMSGDVKLRRGRGTDVVFFFRRVFTQLETWFPSQVVLQSPPIILLMGKIMHQLIW